jgi:hypothetical protein
MGRGLCIRDTGRKRLAALEVDQLAGVPTVLMGAAGALLVFTTNLEDTIDLLGNREAAKTVGNLEGKGQDVNRGQGRARRQGEVCAGRVDT